MLKAREERRSVEVGRASVAGLLCQVQGKRSGGVTETD